MDKNRKLIGILQILIILALGITAITYVLEDEPAVSADINVSQDSTVGPKGDGKITVIASPSQVKEETPAWANESAAQVEDVGTNLALKKSVIDNGHNDVYLAKNITDGISQTYWEGKPGGYPNIITVDLGTTKGMTKIRVRLNPDVTWSKRVQNFSVLSSRDGKNFSEITAAKDYDFDPKTGNMVVVIFEKIVETQFVQLQFTGNTGAGAAQISEFEVY